MQIVKIKGRNSWSTDDGVPLNKSIRKVNYRLAGYDRLLKERNFLDIQLHQANKKIFNLIELNSNLQKKHMI